MSINRGVSPAT